MFTNIKAFGKQNFFTEDGKIQNMYGIVIIHSLGKDDLHHLGIYKLIEQLSKYGFTIAPNPHCTLAFIDINMGDDQVPYDESFVNDKWNKAKTFWGENRFNSFQIGLKYLVLNHQPKRNATRLTINFTHSEIIKIKKAYLEKFPREKWTNYIPRPFRIDAPSTYNFGYSTILDYSTEQLLDINRIIKEFNNSINNNNLEIKELKLVYHQNNFVYDNLRKKH